MKNIFILFAFAAFLFACKTENNSHKGDANVEDLQKAIDEEKEDLSSYEYICDHCQYGSHEAGTCPCGMEFEKNPNFVASAVKPAHDAHKNHDHYSHAHHGTVENDVTKTVDETLQKVEDAHGKAVKTVNDTKDAINHTTETVEKTATDVVKTTEETVEGVKSDIEKTKEALGLEK